MYPVLLHLGPLTIYSYGLMMAIAFLTSAYLTGKEMTRKGLDGELASSMVFWAAIGGLIGGFLAVTWSIRANRLPWLTTVDCISPGMVLGHAIGRIGCELAGDGD